jgi:hypothetical protein
MINSIFGFDMIDSECTPELSQLIELILESRLIQGKLDQGEKLRCIQWILTMNMMQIMNAYRRGKFLGIVEPGDLYTLIQMLFTDSSLRDVCLSEIEQDLQNDGAASTEEQDVDEEF